MVRLARGLRWRQRDAGWGESGGPRTGGRAGQGTRRSPSGSGPWGRPLRPLKSLCLSCPPALTRRLPQPLWLHFPSQWHGGLLTQLRVQWAGAGAVHRGVRVCVCVRVCVYVMGCRLRGPGPPTSLAGGSGGAAAQGFGSLSNGRWLPRDTEPALHARAPPTCPTRPRREAEEPRYRQVRPMVGGAGKGAVGGPAPGVQTDAQRPCRGWTTRWGEQGRASPGHESAEAGKRVQRPRGALAGRSEGCSRAPGLPAVRVRVWVWVWKGSLAALRTTVSPPAVRRPCPAWWTKGAGGRTVCVCGRSKGTLGFHGDFPP